MRASNQYYLSSLLAELTRAIAAAHRYEDLRYRSAEHGRIPPDEAPRRVFEDFYADAAVEPRRAVARSEAPYHTVKASP